MRITESNLNGMWERFVRAAQSVGFDVTNWTMVYGQPSVGQAFRVWEMDPETRGLSSLPMTNDEGWIGNTRREAYEALGHMARTMEAINNNKETNR